MPAAIPGAAKATTLCRAPAVSVGAEHPACDCYTTGQVKLADHPGKVIKCMVDECHFNAMSDCHASGVTLTEHEAHADCLTYRV